MFHDKKGFKDREPMSEKERFFTMSRRDWRDRQDRLWEEDQKEKEERVVAADWHLQEKIRPYQIFADRPATYGDRPGSKKPLLKIPAPKRKRPDISKGDIAEWDPKRVRDDFLGFRRVPAGGNVVPFSERVGSRPVADSLGDAFWENAVDDLVAQGTFELDVEDPPIGSVAPPPVLNGPNDPVPEGIVDPEGDDEPVGDPNNPELPPGSRFAIGQEKSGIKI